MVIIINDGFFCLFVFCPQGEPGVTNNVKGQKGEPGVSGPAGLPGFSGAKGNPGPVGQNGYYHLPQNKALYNWLCFLLTL